MENWFSSPFLQPVIIASFGAWAGIELINTLVLGRRRAPARRRDRGSYWGILLTTYLSFAALVALRGMQLGLVPALVQWLGLGLLWAGIVLREWSILRLGRAFTVVVQVNSDQPLVTSGPYHWVRHPAYTGSIFITGGFGLAVGTWVGAIVAMTVALAGFLYRVRVEEKALLASFGDEYQEYMQHTGRFFPRFI